MENLKNSSNEVCCRVRLSGSSAVKTPACSGPHRLEQLEHTHTWPSFHILCRSTKAPHTHTHRSSLTGPEHAWMIYRVQPTFFSSCNNIFTLFSGICDLKSVADFSTALYPDFVSCCLAEFKVNPPQTVTATLALHACACVPCQSPPLSMLTTMKWQAVCVTSCSTDIQYWTNFRNRCPN